jgi:hypothetical protein
MFMSKINCQNVAIAIVLSFVAAAHVGAATVTPVSCSSTDVQSAINNAANGATVLLPVCGTTTWNTTVTIPNTKGITLDGNNLVLVRGSLADWSPLIKISPNASTTTRITRFKMSDTKSSQGYFITTSGGNESSAKFRIDHCTFMGLEMLRHIGINDPIYGLLDHNTFTWSGNNEVIHNEAYGASSTAGWTNDVTPGSAQALYIEDNDFVNQTSGSPAYFWGGSAVQGYYGARTVIRYNTLTMAQIDMHGTAGAIGARWWEIYENTFVVVPNGNQDPYMAIRAGSGVIFNNHTGGATNLGIEEIELVEEDGGYPALYQIGRGKNQTLDPAYVWGNDGNMSIKSHSSNVQAGRDFILSSKPGYTPYTYPHPLQNGGGVTTSPTPEAPSNVRIIQ